MTTPNAPRAPFVKVQIDTYHSSEPDKRRILIYNEADQFLGGICYQALAQGLETAVNTYAANQETIRELRDVIQKALAFLETGTTGGVYERPLQSQLRAALKRAEGAG